MEIEAKFALPDVATLERLAQAETLSDFRLGPAATRSVQDVYLDTPDRRLLAAGYTCRRREQGDRIVLTVKATDEASGAVHRRTELEIELPDDRPPVEWGASPVRDLVVGIVGTDPLEPLVRLDQTRVTRGLFREARPVAELSLDDVQVGASAKTCRFLELEAELRPEGTEEDLAQLVTYLQDEWKLVAEPRSKFARALALAQGWLTPEERALCMERAAQADASSRRARALLALDEGASDEQAAQRAGLSVRRVRYWSALFQAKRIAIFADRTRTRSETARPSRDESERLPLQPGATPTEPEPAHHQNPVDPVRQMGHAAAALPGLELDDSMAEAALKILTFQFRRMLDHEAGTRAGDDIEELHDMRVATRRMRAALRVFGDALDPDTIRPLAKGLRRTGRALGAVRDLDVLRDKIRRYLETLPDDRQGELDRLLAVLEEEHGKAREALLAYLDGDAYARFKEKFGNLMDAPGSGARLPFAESEEPRPYRVRHVLPGLLIQGYSGVRAQEEWVTGSDIPLTRLHRLRITAKGFRYTLEFFRELLGSESEACIETIKRLQDHLGNLQDAVVACGLLRDFLLWGTWGHAQDSSPSAELVVAPGLAAYLATRQREIQQRLQDFPSVWASIASDEFTRPWLAVVGTMLEHQVR